MQKDGKRICGFVMTLIEKWIPLLTYEWDPVQKDDFKLKHVIKENNIQLLYGHPKQLIQQLTILMGQ